MARYPCENVSEKKKLANIQFHFNRDICYQTGHNNLINPNFIDNDRFVSYTGTHIYIKTLITKYTI